jgi:putative nucleotidyltransferase with HDIG domain
MGQSSWRHLAVRLVDVLTSRPLTGSEGIEVREWLRPAEQGAFFDQSVADQRHGLNCARFVASRLPHREDLIRSALLHDLGKRHARLGPIGRSLVTAWSKLGGRTRGRAHLYVQHGEAGARELEALGVEALVSEFACHHHGERPPAIAEADWDVLQTADRPRPRRKSESGGPNRDR